MHVRARRSSTRRERAPPAAAAARFPRIPCGGQAWWRKGIRREAAALVLPPRAHPLALARLHAHTPFPPAVAAPPTLRAAAGVAARGMMMVSTPADTHMILSATGPDRAGIVFDLARLVLDNNGDIQESRMMRMGSDFTLMMRIAAPKSDAEQIAKKLDKVSGMTIITHPVTAKEATRAVPKPVFRAHFSGGLCLGLGWGGWVGWAGGEG